MHNVPRVPKRIPHHHAVIVGPAITVVKQYAAVLVLIPPVIDQIRV